MGAIAAFFLLVIWLVMFALGAGLYLLPTIVAVTQHRNNVAAIAAINILLGWSFVGWIVALVMALTKDAQPVQVVQVQQHVGYPPMGYASQPPQQQPGQVQYPHTAQVAQTYEHPMQPAPGTELRSVQPPEHYQQ